MTPSFCFRQVVGLIACVTILLAGCGGGDGPAIKAQVQNIRFGAAPELRLNGNATVSATSTSGLVVSYSSLTTAICSINATTGQALALAAGTCTIAADQEGNDTYAPAAQVTQNLVVVFDPAQTIQFGAVPTLSLYGSVNVLATASSGLPVTYSSMSPQVCSVNSSTGVVTSIAPGDCTIAANQTGDANYHAASQVTQTIPVAANGTQAGIPGVPTGVAATLGATPNTVMVSFVGPTNSGGSPIKGYTVASIPSGITVSASASPISVTCPSSCAGYAFSVLASNSVGDGTASTAVDVLTNFQVTTTFLEPMTQPKNSIFIGSFTFNSSARTVTVLRGILSESMTGDQIAYPNDTMRWLPLNSQLSSVFDPTLGGLLVTTFLLPSTNTLSANPTFGGTDGWSPGTGFGLYYGFPDANPGNAYTRIFVNTTDPTTPLSQAQLDKLAYADCAPGGMMGGTCMTGTSVAGYGTLGSMSGFPLKQVISRQ